MRKLEIDRKIWLRGEGCYASKLLRRGDKKQCCIGCYLSACGVSPDNLLDRGEPYFGAIPDEADWLGMRDENALPLFKLNDDEKIDDVFREEKIRDEFIKHGVEVTFVN